MGLRKGEGDRTAAEIIKGLQYLTCLAASIISVGAQRLTCIDGILLGSFQKAESLVGSLCESRRSNYSILVHLVNICIKDNDKYGPGRLRLAKTCRVKCPCSDLI